MNFENARFSQERKEKKNKIGCISCGAAPSEDVLVAPRAHAAAAPLSIGTEQCKTCQNLSAGRPVQNEIGRRTDANIVHVIDRGYAKSGQIGRTAYFNGAFRPVAEFWSYLQDELYAICAAQAKWRLLKRSGFKTDDQKGPLTKDKFRDLCKKTAQEKVKSLKEQTDALRKWQEDPNNISFPNPLGHTIKCGGFGMALTVRQVLTEPKDNCCKKYAPFIDAVSETAKLRKAHQDAGTPAPSGVMIALHFKWDGKTSTSATRQPLPIPAGSDSHWMFVEKVN